METKKETTEGVMTIEPSDLREESLLLEEREQQNAMSEQGDAADGAPSAKKAKRKRNIGTRILLWMLLKSIVPILCILALAGGLYVGFVIVGKQSLDEALKWETWKHMYDLVFAET